MEEHPARPRIAEVLVTQAGEDRRGSGCLAAPGWVLTAAHVVADASEVTVWLGAPPILEPDAGIRVDLRRILLAQNADLALLPVGGSGNDPSWERALVGRLDRDASTRVPVAAAGFPRFKLRPAPGRPKVVLRELHYAIGTIVGGANAKTRTHELALPIAPEDPDPTRHSPWEGTSGAAVWSGQRLVGVVGQHHPAEGRGRLSVRPIEELFSHATAGHLSSWRAALPQLPAAPADLEVAAPPTTRKIEVARARRAAHRWAPLVLIGRRAELAALEDFASSGARWRWIKGDAFAGKTALLAWFALHPPDGVEIAACFLCRTTSDNTSVYALDVLTRQLALFADQRYQPPQAPSVWADDILLRAVLTKTTPAQHP